MTITPPPIHLVVLDIDGVLTAGEAQPLDLDLLRILAGLNRDARDDPTRPAVTLCTGRPAPYVEVMLQAIDGHLPGIFENGAGLYVPVGYQFLPHPDLAGDRSMAAVRARLDETLVADGTAYVQLGKEHSLTLFPYDPGTLPALRGAVRAALGGLLDQVDLVYSTACLNVLPRGIDKGKGIEFLARQTGVDPAQMLGVGDSDVDLPFLERVGVRAAPANANPAIQRLAHYVSPLPTSQGVRDILRRYSLMA